MNVHPLLRVHRPDSIFAWRSGQPIRVETFLRDVATLAALLPSRGHVVNLCPDRYRFAVGFAAALCRGQVNLLPPHDAPDLLAQLRTDYPDLYCLTDAASAPAGIDVFRYPAKPARDLIPPAYVHLDLPPEVPVIAAEQPAAVLFTSGSTGRPRPHARTWGELVNSALAEGSRLGIERLGQAVLLGTVPHQHSYGLESLLMLALQHGLALHAERLFYPADIRAHLAAAPRPRMLVTTPVHLRVLLAETEPPPPVDLVLCATAPLATQLAREAEARFAVSLYEIYGCSEAGQIAARRTARTEEWRCLDGIALRQDATGTWASGVPIAVETLLPDMIELRDPTRFLLHGRIADMVNVAGKRTSLVHLNYHLNAIDGVVDGAFALCDEAETEAVSRLAAFVVAPGRNAEFILAELRRRIDSAFLPRPVCLVPALPRNALGKLPREEVLRLIADARTASSQRHDPERPGVTADPPVRSGDAVRAPGVGVRASGDDVQASKDEVERPGDRSGMRRLTGSATRHFAVGHPAADGHFPGNPIIPGAVLLREVLAVIGASGEVSTGPATEIRSAKFHQPVRPGDTLIISWTGDGGGEIRFTCSIVGSERPAVTGALRPGPP
jgi:acyl-CoA synthetase (AMP-forming)/AMP-acid ligase II